MRGKNHNKTQSILQANPVPPPTPAISFKARNALFNSRPSLRPSEVISDYTTDFLYYDRKRWTLIIDFFVKVSNIFLESRGEGGQQLFRESLKIHLICYEVMADNSVKRYKS